MRDSRKTPRGLRNCPRLGRKVRIFVPSTVGVNTAADTTAHVAQAQALFARLFGGATSYGANGAWVSPTAGLVLENVTIVEACADDASFESGIDAVADFARTMCADLAQDCVAVEADNALYLVDAPNAQKAVA